MGTGADDAPPCGPNEWDGECKSSNAFSKSRLLASIILDMRLFDNVPLDPRGLGSRFVLAFFFFLGEFTFVDCVIFVSLG